VAPRPDTLLTASQISPEQVARLRRLLVDEYIDWQARVVGLQDPIDLEADVADVLLARAYEAMEEIEAALTRLRDDA
jgi:hypothetical protein